MEGVGTMVKEAPYNWFHKFVVECSVNIALLCAIVIGSIEYIPLPACLPT